MALQVHRTLVEAVKDLAPGGVYKKMRRDEDGLPVSPPSARASPQPGRTARLQARKDRGSGSIMRVPQPMPQYPVFGRPKMKTFSPLPPQLSSSTRIDLKTFTKDGSIDSGFIDGAFNQDGYKEDGSDKGDSVEEGYEEDGSDKGGSGEDGYEEDGFDQGGSGKDSYEEDGNEEDGYEENE